jgi:chitinase
MKPPSPYLASLGICFLLAGCFASRPAPTSIPTPAAAGTKPSPETFRIIGYAPSWDTAANEIQYDKLTHINYAFLLPKPDGTFEDIERPDKLRNIVTYAHNAGVKVLISAGGWGLDAQLEQLASDSKTRAVFVAGVAHFARDYKLDGVDIDWEYPHPGASSQNYLALMRELRDALPKDSLLTTAVAALGSNAEGIPAETFGLVDFVNLMVYDKSDTDHSPYSFAVESLDYWSRRGLPPEKTVLGVPFYAKPGGVAYRQLVQTDPQAANQDAINYSDGKVYYNGIPTIQNKTRLALQRASGVMIWELEQDSLDSTSLLNAIYQTVYGK